MSDWTICIATVGARNAHLERMAAALAPQVAAHDGRVEVLVYWDNFESTLGQVRQALLDEAGGVYVNFVDDDDELPDYYVDRVLEALEEKPDYVGWRQQLYMNGRPTKPTFHSLRYDSWWDDEHGYYRHISHLNPIRRELALLGRFDRNVPEDVDWAHQIYDALPPSASEVFIDDVMYLYRYDPKASLWSKKTKPRGTFPRPVLPEHFAFHPASSGLTH